MATIAAVVMTLCGVGTMIPYIYLRIKRRHVGAIILKVSTSVCFILTAGASILAANGALFEQYKFLFFGILFGEVSGLLGDYWLDMKDMHTKHHDTYVFAGFTSFLVGHLFFIAGLFITYGVDLKTVLLMLGVGAVLTAGVLLTEKPMKLHYGKFRGISAGYCFTFGLVITAACCSAFANAPAADLGGNGPVQALVMAIGLVIFLASDLVLSGTYFGENKKRPIDYILNYLFYYGGQFTIALSLIAITA